MSYPVTKVVHPDFVNGTTYTEESTMNPIIADINGYSKNGFADFNLVIIVSAQGTRNNIEDAITAASALSPSVSNKVLILVLPGIYGESELILPDYVYLVGMNPETCIIKPPDPFPDPHPNTIIETGKLSSGLYNLTIDRSDIADSGRAVFCPTPKDVEIGNCVVIGTGIGGNNDGEIFIDANALSGLSSIAVRHTTIKNQGTVSGGFSTSPGIRIENAEDVRVTIDSVKIYPDEASPSIVDGIDISNPIGGTGKVHVAVRHSRIMAGNGTSTYPITSTSPAAPGDVIVYSVFNSFRYAPEVLSDLTDYSFIDPGQVI
jgi:hypothetical protein